jgi:hypothetical protein
MILVKLWLADDACSRPESAHNHHNADDQIPLRPHVRGVCGRQVFMLLIECGIISCCTSSLTYLIPATYCGHRHL